MLATLANLVGGFEVLERRPGRLGIDAADVADEFRERLLISDVYPHPYPHLL